MPLKPKIRSLVLVSNSARIGRPKRRIDGIDQVIKAEQLKTRLSDEFDKAPDWKLATVIGKEGLATFARDLAALHRPIAVDWAARFGLDTVPVTSAPSQPRTPIGAPSRQTDGASPRPWLVKYDGPCSGCGTMLTKGSPAVWVQSTRKMRCLACSEAG